jgi:hypothetical protein
MAVCGAGLISGCTPARIALHLYPEEFDEDPDIVETELRAFVDTVLPGITRDDGHPVRLFYDDAFPIWKYRGFFASDLCKTAGSLFGERRFCDLDEARRAAVIDEGVSSGGSLGDLYAGAIFVTQVVYFAGLYDPEGDCSFIDFKGSSPPRSRAQFTFDDPDSFLGHEIGLAGNSA